MQDTLLIIHNFLRWIVLFFLLSSLTTSIIGLIKGGEFSKKSDKFSLFTLITSHLQFLLGVILFFISPKIQGAMLDIGMAMSNKEIRFFLTQHSVGMVLALTLITIGRVRLKKSDKSKFKHKTIVIFFGIALILILGSIPWFRPLLRL